MCSSYPRRNREAYSGNDRSYSAFASQFDNQDVSVLRRESACD